MKKLILLLIIPIVTFAYAGIRIDLGIDTNIDPCGSFSLWGKETYYGFNIAKRGDNFFIGGYKDIYDNVALQTKNDKIIWGMKGSVRQGFGYMTGIERFSILTGCSVAIFYKQIEVWVGYQTWTYIYDTYCRSISSIYFGVAFEQKVLP